ncbi:NTP transferase domain-containing protein [Parasphingopyxis algicola]|uniref:NTP transferase domain-containing protein n=1 Tax=Parasphingopyxis algicola TaxID=2026624 RepID=UPI001C409592|nr:NTP transferase domain-containing protein [Parasphingopyxis algicola]
MTEHPAPTILVLAGKRDGKLDPLAERAGVCHKAVVPIGGRPLIGHVLATLEQAWADARIIVSIHDPAILEQVEEVQRLRAAGRLEMAKAQHGIVESVEEASKRAEWPLLITTGDNALTTGNALRALHAHGMDAGADVVLGLARREDIQAAHPDGQYGFYQFKDMAISNCNLFWLRDPRAFSAVEAFRSGGQFFKNRSRIIKAFGLMNLIRFLLKLETVDGAMERLSKRFGVKVVAHRFEDGRLAIDVDNERTYRVTEELLEAAI